MERLSINIDQGTIKQLRTLFDERDSSHDLGLNISFGLGSLLTTNTYIPIADLHREYQIPVNKFIHDRKARISSQIASWDALTYLIVEVINQGDAEVLKRCFATLQATPVGNRTATDHLKICLGHLLEKLLPGISSGDDWIVDIPSEDKLKQIKSPALARNLRQLLKEHREHLVKFLDGPVPSSVGKPIKPPAQGAREELDGVLNLLGQMEKDPVQFLHGTFEISIKSSRYPVVKLKFKSP